MSDEVLKAQQNVVDMRRRVLADEAVDPEELAEAVAQIRKSREAELMAKAKRGGRRKTPEDDGGPDAAA